jgi:hypothetical protein
MTALGSGLRRDRREWSGWEKLLRLEMFHPCRNALQQDARAAPQAFDW